MHFASMSWYYCSGHYTKKCFGPPSAFFLSTFLSTFGPFYNHLTFLSELLLIFLLGPPSYGSFKNITNVSLLVRQFGNFFRNGPLIFSGFLNQEILLEYSKSVRVRYSRKILI